MSSYKNFTECVNDFFEHFNEFVENNEEATIKEFFDNPCNVDFIDELVVTYHNEIFTTAGNNFLNPKQVPAGIMNLAGKRGVKFPRGLSIKDDDSVRELFVMKVVDYRSDEGLTKERVREIRRENRDLVSANEEERKRTRMQ